MKTRTGFVSNSSSSSFLIPRAALTDEQLAMIENHLLVARASDPVGYRFADHYPPEEGDAWKLKVTDAFVAGWTIIDNFDMLRFLDRDVKVPQEYLLTETGHFWFAPWEEDDDED